MKKILSFVLVLAMVLGCMTTAFAGKFTDVEAGSKYEDAITVLNGLGVIDGKTETTYGPTDTLTRAQMAKLCVAALGYKPTGTVTALKFKDVKATHWAAPYIDYATTLGIIAGRTATKFDPDAAVSYNEAIKMVVASLGYTEAGLTGEWPANYVNKAIGLKILDKVAIGTASCTRAEAAQLLYNALGQKIVVVNANGSIDDKAADSMLDRLDAKEYVPGNGSYGRDGKYFIYTTEKAAVNMDAYKGHKIKAYANSDNEIIAVVDDKSVELKGTLTGNTLKVDGVKYTLNDNNATVCITNSDNISTSNANTQVKSDLQLVAEVDGLYINTVDAIVKWVGVDYQWDADAAKRLADKSMIDGYSFAKTTNKKIDTDAFTLYGVASLDDIKEDDVVTVYNGKNNITKVEVSDKTVVGKVEKITSDNPAKYVIGGKTYSTVNGLTFTNGKEGTFYLNYAGKIAFFEEKEDAFNEYGLYLDARYTDWEVNNRALDQVKLVVADATKKVFDVTSDVNDDLFTPTSAELVKYSLDEDGKVATIKNLDWNVKGGAVKVTKNGVIYTTSYQLTEDTVIIAKEGTKYATVALSSIKDKEFTNFKFYVASGTKIAFVLIGDEGLFEEDGDFLLITNFRKVSKATAGEYYYELDGFCNGEAFTDMVATVAAIEGDDTDFTGKNDGTVYLPTLNAKGEIIDLDSVYHDTIALSVFYDSAYGSQFDRTDVIADENHAIAVKNGHTIEFYDFDTVSSGYGHKFVPEEDVTSVTLSDDVVVYVYNADSKKYEVGSVSDLNELTADDYGQIYLISVEEDDYDEGFWYNYDYEIVVCVKPAYVPHVE